MRRLRVMLYCVTRVGIGHFVRTREIARAAGERHDAYLVDDGAPVPDRPIHASIQRIRIPSVIREGSEVLPGISGQSLSETLAERRDQLVDAVCRIRPDVLLIEHFPFSKLEHTDEILPMIDAARASNRGAIVLCSIRDLAPQPNYRPVGEDYRRNVLATLHQWFDGLLVHADDRFVRLEHSLEWADAIRLPLAYTGFVAEPLTPPTETSPCAHADKWHGTIIVSGGGRRDAALYDGCARAWRELERRGSTGGRNMVLIAPAGINADVILSPDLHDGVEYLGVESFSPALVDRMLAADLSISHAGYNTCTNILLTGVRAILIPHPNSADQIQRALRMEQAGFCRVIEEDALQPERIANAIEQQLATTPIRHDIRLDGADRSVALMEHWIRAPRI